MTALQLKVLGLGLATILLLAVGTGAGVWLAAEHYRPLLDTAQTDLASVTVARDHLVILTEEQGRKLGQLVVDGQKRERDAAEALARAKEEARPDYAAANRLLRERTGGDPAEAAAAIIDRELGL